MKARRGKILVMFCIMLVVLVGMGAFAVDTGYISLSRAKLQCAADAAALAALDELPDSQAAVARAQVLADHNFEGKHNGVVAANAVEFGQWSNGVFTSTPAATANAVRVTGELSTQNDNSLRLFFGSFLGVSTVDIEETSIAATSAGGVTSRFLIDEDMFDKDVTSIEDLADSLGVDAEELVTAKGINDGKNYGDWNWTWEDNFLDIPGGSILLLPTGQGTSYDNNDAGLFDITGSDFPFTDEQSLEDFLFYSETGGDTSKWGTDLNSVYNQLDPLEGVTPVTDDSLYSGFVDANTVHISPVFPSDISTLNMSGGVPRVNALGLRRGLLAYKIIAVGNDPDGGGSVLPFLEIEVVAPTTISMEEVSRPSSGSSGSGEGQIVY